MASAAVVAAARIGPIEPYRREEVITPIVLEPMKRYQRFTVIFALIVSVIRLAGRTAYVFVTFTPEGIPLICTALISMACLIRMLYKGGCWPVALYIIFEPILSTTLWIVILYSIDTNDFCRDMGDSVCDMPESELKASEYITRPYYTWLFLLIPGFIFDIIFICIFRTCPGGPKA